MLRLYSKKKAKTGIFQIAKITEDKKTSGDTPTKSKIFSADEVARINKMRDFNLTRGSTFWKGTVAKINKSHDSRYKTLTQDTIFDCFSRDIKDKFVQMKQRHLTEPEETVRDGDDISYKLSNTYQDDFIHSKMNEIFTSKTSYINNQKGNNMKTILRGKSKHFTNLRPFDIKTLQEEGNKTMAEKSKNKGIKPWLEESMNQLSKVNNEYKPVKTQMNKRAQTQHVRIRKNKPKKQSFKEILKCHTSHW